MSAFAVVYERSNTPVDPGVLERVMERLSHRGPDGRSMLLTDQVALGHWHFWTTPEEVGERQPLALSRLPFKIVLDGRLDNRSELIAELGLSSEDGKRLSDAALILHAYADWGEHCLEHFIGPFALVVVDERSGELLFGRDALGDRTLFYSWQGTRLVIASEQWAVAGADGLAEELDEKAVANYFALEETNDGRSFFKNVSELLPAQVMLINASGQRSWRYWQPDSSKRVRCQSDKEYAEGFLALLEESIRCRMRSITPAGVLLSGGLDSGSVACLAARMISPQPLTTISYVFDELQECDERGYIETVKEKWGIHSIQVPCDDLWPFKNLQDMPCFPNQPDGNIYRMIIERTFQRAREEGFCVLLTGHFGDELYDGEEDWLFDLISEGRLWEAAQDIKLHIQYTGLRRTWRSAYLRRVGIRMLQEMPQGNQFINLRKRRRRNVPVWLTPFSAEKISFDQPQLAPEFTLKNNLLGSSTATDCASGTYFTSRHGLEFRHPYRDRRLVEYVLALPAHQLYFHGQYKFVLRTAMQGILPEAIRTRSTPTNLLTLLERGKVREKNNLETLLQDTNAAWRKYVRPDWLMEHWKLPTSPENDGADKVIPWLCLSFARWYQSLFN